MAYPIPTIPARPALPVAPISAEDGGRFWAECQMYTSMVIGHVDTAVQTAWDVIDDTEYRVAEARYDDLAAATELLLQDHRNEAAAMVAERVAPEIIVRIAAALHEVGYHLNEDFEAEEDDLEDYFSDDDD